MTWCEGMAQAMAAYSGQKFSKFEPTLSFKMPKSGTKKEEQGGHRVQVFYGPTCKNKFAMTIRLYRNKIFNLDNYKIRAEDKTKIIAAVKEKDNLLISGGTGTGKTSFLNMLLRFIEKDERLVTIEGVSELIVPQDNHCSLFYSENQTSASGKTVSELLNDTLRMRPDRIIMGELRKENCFVFSRAINTGHEGSMATIHANSPEDALDAMVDNVVINGDAPEGAINIFRNQLKKRIGGVIQLKREGGKVSGYYKEIKDDSVN